MMNIQLLYTLHGLLQEIAFLVLFPIGIIIALCKLYIGSKWFILHILFQTVGIVCVISAVLIMAYAKYLEKPTNKSSRKSIPLHVYIGIAIVILILFQVVWAVLMRDKIDRNIWTRIHIILASIILILGWTNLYLGYKLYKNRF